MSKSFIKKILGPLISLIFIVLIIKQIDISKVVQAFTTLNYKYLIFILPFYYFSFVVRALRWDKILSSQNKIKLDSLLGALFIGYTANCLLPARMGDIYRAYFFGKRENISKMSVFASIVIERIFDGTTLFLILLAIILSLYSKSWIINLAYMAGSVFIGGFVFLLIFAKFGKSPVFKEKIKLILNKFPQKTQKLILKPIKKVQYFLNSFIDGLEVFHSFNLLSKSLFLTLIVWIIEGIFMYFVIKSFGISIGIISVMFALCVVVSSTMIPAGPASIGPYQYGYMLALGMFGIQKETAFAISIVNQFIFIVLICIAGLFYMWKYHLNIKAVETAMEASDPELTVRG